MNKQIILIGGMPTAGKSTIAEAIAKHYDLPWISTDQIRMVMQSVANPDEHPALFEGMNITAEQFFEKYSLDEIAKQEYDQAAEVWTGIKRFIDTGWAWRKGCVIEGVSIIPSLVAERYSDNPEIKAIFLSDTDTERIREVVFSRGLFTHPEKYGDDVKEKEIEWVKIFDGIIRREAERCKFPVIELGKDSTDFEKVLVALEQ